jgi:hypothetical protein
MAARLQSLPILVVLGTTVLLLGAFGDLTYHLVGAEPLLRLGLDRLVGEDGYRAHLITFAGMLISLTGLLVHAVRTP